MADDLTAEQTPGFRVGEKKTMDEYKKLDAEDDAMNRWKASLGVGTGKDLSDPSDPRHCIIKALTMQVDGRPDITIDLSQPGAVDTLKKQPFKIKEGSTYTMKVTFVVQHQVLSGLKYLQSIKRKGIPVGKDEEMMGSYGPNTTDRPVHTKTFPPEEAPSGMMARAKYDAVSKFVDDDGVTHLKFEWAFEIAKDWK